MTSHDEWLALTREEIIDPQMPICDPHHHLWNASETRPFPPKEYLLEQLLQDIRPGHNIVKTVFIECESSYRKDGPMEMRPVGETEFVRSIVEQNVTGHVSKIGIAAGIVGCADLTLGNDAMPVLEAHKTAGRGNFRGIRHISVWDPDPKIASPRSPGKGLLLNPKFREGFSCLKKAGLSFDGWMYFHQLSDLADLAGAFPETTIILNHVGGLVRMGSYAERRDEVFQEWKRGVAEVAKCPNILMKLGGVGMPRSGFGWDKQQAPPSSTQLAEDMSPFFMYCIEKFGVDRCMFESNYPVDRISCSYNVLWNAFKRIAKDFSAKEKAALFHDTAVKAYRL